MTNLFNKLQAAQHSVSLAHNQLRMAESMATIRPCPLVDKSIAAYEAALEHADSVRKEMASEHDADLLAMDIRCGRK